MRGFGKFICDMLFAGVIGFGGGSALIPVIESRVTGKGGLVSEEDFDQDVMIASITPGALPVELASGVGRRRFGRAGMVFGACAMAFPGALLSISVYLVLFLASGSLDADQLIIAKGVLKVAAAFISAYIIYHLICYIVKTTSIAKQGGYLTLCVFVIALVAVLSSGKNFGILTGLSDSPILATAIFGVKVFSMPAQFILLGMFIVLLVVRLVQTIRGRNDEPSAAGGRTFKFRSTCGDASLGSWAADMTCWLVFALVSVAPAFILCADQLKVFFLPGVASALLSFGGGDAYITIAEGVFVSTGIVESALFYGTIVTVVNILPGSILCKTLSGIGFFVGLSTGSVECALACALAGFAIGTAVSCMTFRTAACLYDRIASSKLMTLVIRWIRPVVSGMLVNVALSLVVYCFLR